MHYTAKYSSPIGELLIAADDIGLVGVWLESEKYYAKGLDSNNEEKDNPVLIQAKAWLDIYFSGKEPDFMPPIHLIGSDFQVDVWKILQTIPYGCTTTYGAIAQQIAENRGIHKMSAQAVGGAVGHNEISIIIPCHRVVGTNGSLTGYAGGIDKKIFLLKCEGVDLNNLFVPKHSTAP